MSYTTIDYIFAIERELIKRRVTYPKIVQKKQKQWSDQGEDVLSNTIDLTTTQRIQSELLESALIILNSRNPCGQNIAHEIFRELQRELRMRVACFPRWVKWERMDTIVAELETAVWTALVKYYHETFVPDATWRKPAVKRSSSITHG